jgi:beta-glucosidase
MSSKIKYFLIGSYALFLTSCGPLWTETEKEGLNKIENKKGQTLVYSPISGVKILTVDRFAFKDLNQNDTLDPYEDWRLSADKRAENLASKMTIEQIAGLMLYSGHQRIPGGGFGRGGTYNGKPFKDSGAKASDLTDQQVDFLTNDNLRHVLITSVESTEVAAIWNNNAQALVEGLGMGIPANNSSDPRHGAKSDAEYTLGAGGEISRWPGPIGLAASFEPQLVRQFGDIASKEYRALGIATALSPQIDMATDPRWSRFNGTFGPSPDLATDMGSAYIDGFQTSSKEKEIGSGWGHESVNAMAKHWPGGGTGEGGRDAHLGLGKFGVYPGDNLQTQLKPFIEGAFALEGGTKMASAVMPYYTISFDQDPGGENVGNAYSKYLITDLLRDKYGYDGVVCTDWRITYDNNSISAFVGMPWGVEHLSIAERHYLVLLAGCDQFGGNNDAIPVLEAYQMGVKEFGEDFMRARFEKSAVRLLKNIFRIGLFENPYVDVDESKSIVGNSEFMKAGYEAQLKSVVLLKNKGEVLPLNKKATVFIPQRFVPATKSFFGSEIPSRWEDPIDKELASKYFNITDDPEKADLALVVVKSPEISINSGYSVKDAKNGGNGFVPISLQYGDYLASEARESSLASDSTDTGIIDRSYKNKSAKTNNSTDLDLLVKTKQQMKGKPIITVLKLSQPTVVAEFENDIDALLVNFGVQDQAILDVITGSYEPTGLLPLQMPLNMATVETQKEDVAFDMVPYTDSESNVYDFGYGLNWKGLILDERNQTYHK